MNNRIDREFIYINTNVIGLDNLNNRSKILKSFFKDQNLFSIRK